jgi:23S rRNA A1618 N6-methylase RlmF
MVTAGGEVAFVSRMVEESLRLRNQVTWYTTMLGKLSSVSVIVEKLMLEHGNHNYAVTEFVQGTRTKRWAVAWSWTDLRPAMVFPQDRLYSWLIRLARCSRHHRLPETSPSVSVGIHL